jgi:hypothetical protein
VYAKKNWLRRKEEIEHLFMYPSSTTILAIAFDRTQLSYYVIECFWYLVVWYRSCTQKKFWCPEKDTVREIKSIYLSPASVEI